MKVYHLLLSTEHPDAVRALGARMGEGDVLVAAPEKNLVERYDAIIEKQLVQRRDALKALSALAADLKGLAASDAFNEEADILIDRIHTVLCQGMSLSFRDNSLTDYLNAFLVQLCGKCVASMLCGSTFLDGRELVTCESTGGIPVVDRALTEAEIGKRFGVMPGASGKGYGASGKGSGTSGKATGMTVVAGSYGRKVTGETVDLGIAGSELTANILGAALKAESVCFCVEGFTYSGIPELTYEEAAQRFSGGVPVYPPAMLPARSAGLTLEVAGADGKPLLTILPAGKAARKGITGVVTSGPMTLFTVYGTGLLGSIGISSAIFGALARDGVNIHFISQSLSEYSISFAVRRASAKAAEQAVKSLIGARMSDISYDCRPVEIVSVFGQGMRNVPGISGRVYSALGEAGVNVVAASQGGEELSISIVVDESAAVKACGILSQIQ